MFKKIIKKPLKISAVSLALVFFIFSVLVPVFKSTSVSASLFPDLTDPFTTSVNEAYMFYSPHDGTYLKGLNDALQDDDENDSSVGQTAVFARSGVFGKTPVALSLDTGRSGCAQTTGVAPSSCGGGHFGGGDATLYVYKTVYYCQPGKGLIQNGGDGNKNASYQIDYSISVNLAGSNSLFDSNGNLNDSVRLHWAGITHASYWGKDKPNQIRKELGDDEIDLGGLPKECRPNISTSPDNMFSDNPNDAEVKDSRVNVMIPVWAKASKKQKEGWGNLDNKAPNAGGSIDAAGDDENTSCGGGLLLGWIICGITEAVQSFGEWVFKGYIQPMMENNPLSTDPQDPFYQSWQGFRFLANILLVVSLMAVVYSQTRGGSG